jgi:hypothetical protein
MEEMRKLMKNRVSESAIGRVPAQPVLSGTDHPYICSGKGVQHTIEIVPCYAHTVQVIVYWAFSSEIRTQIQNSAGSVLKSCHREREWKDVKGKD